MSADKTEEPTAKRLRDARERGQVAKSQEISSTAVVTAIFLYVWVGFDWISGELKSLMLLASDCMAVPFGEGLKIMAQGAMRTFLILALPGVLLAAVAGAAGHLGQTGVMFAFKAATPSLDKLNPKQWFGKVFALKNLVEFLRSVLKIAVVCTVFYLVFMDTLPLLLRLPGFGLEAVSVALGIVMRKTAAYCLTAFAAVAAVDWLFQKHQFLKEQRMSKDEVKNEYKEMEGDPQIKGQRKQMHQELVMSDQVQSVKRADVLVTNPTHLAIAIEYKEGETPLPLILAKGEGFMAERMIQEAEKAGVPIMRNVPLAHDLFNQGHELEYIPSDLIEAVAEVLVWLRELREKGDVQ